MKRLMIVAAISLTFSGCAKDEKMYFMQTKGVINGKNTNNDVHVAYF
jgi:hypothetical protein